MSRTFSDRKTSDVNCGPPQRRFGVERWTRHLFTKGARVKAIEISGLFFWSFELMIMVGNPYTVISCFYQDRGNHNRFWRKMIHQFVRVSKLQNWINPDGRKWLITMVAKSPCSPSKSSKNGINRGDPNHLQVLGWSSKWGSDFRICLSAEFIKWSWSKVVYFYAICLSCPASYWCVWLATGLRGVVFLGVEKVYLLKSTPGRGTLFGATLRTPTVALRDVSATPPPPSVVVSVFWRTTKSSSWWLFGVGRETRFWSIHQGCINLGYLEFILKHSLGKKSGQSHRYPCIAEIPSFPY